MNTVVSPQQAWQHVFPGNFVEVVCRNERTGTTDGTAVYQITSGYQIDAAGEYFEVQFLGASSPGQAAELSALFGASGLVHLCLGDPCVAGGGAARPVVHVKTFRPRQAQDLTEPWVQPNFALQALRAHYQSNTSTAPGTGAASSGSGKVPGAPPVAVERTEREKKLRAKLDKLQKQAGQRVGASLFERAAKVRKAGGDSSDEDSNPVFREGPSRRDSPGNRIVDLAKSAPGALMESGLDEVRKYLKARGGLDAGDADKLAPVMMTYFRSVWQGRFPPSETGLRTNTELELLATAIDALLEGRLEEVGDLLVQRFKSLQMSHLYGWKVAQELELSNRSDVSIVTMEEKQEALRAYQRDHKVLEGLGKGKGPSR